MEKNLIIAVLIVIVLVMLLWPGKNEHQDNNTHESGDKKLQITDKNHSNSPSWTQPQRPYTNFQYSPTPGEYHPYVNMPNPIYGVPQTQPQPYGVPQMFPGMIEQSPLYPPQQTYGADNWQYPQYVGPKYRFRDPNRTELQNPYPTNRYGDDNSQLDYRQQPNLSPSFDQDRYLPYQEQQFFNNSPKLQPYTLPQNNGYRGRYQ